MSDRRRPSEALPPRPLVLGLFYLHMLCSSAAYAQRFSTSFGPYADLALGYTPIDVAWGTRGRVATSEIVVLAKNPPALYFYGVDPSGQIVQSDPPQPVSPSQRVVAADLDQDGSSDYILLEAEGVALNILKRKGEGFQPSTLPLLSPADRIHVADINNDRRPDILVYGRNRAGVTTFLGRPDGSLAAGPLLFPEISVSDLKTADLNRDGITDVFLLNWLNNQLAVFYGISRMVFSEQVALDLSGEPGVLALSPISRERTLEIATTIPETQSIHLFSANALGELEPTGNLAVPGRPGGVSFADVNRDGVQDIVASFRSGISVSFGSLEGGFSPAHAFYGGEEMAAWTLTDVDRDGRPDLALVDQHTPLLRILGNSGWSGAVRWPAQYCVGAAPRGLAVRDLNGDGLPDIAVASLGSSQLSILYNGGDGRFSGPSVIPTASSPAYVRAVTSGKEGEPVLIVSHPSMERISVIRLEADPARSHTYTIPTGSNPYVVFATRDSTSRQLEIVTRTVSLPDRSYGLSLFEQLRDGQFLERSLRPLIPQRVIGLSIDDLTRNGMYDLIVVSHDRATKRSALAVGLAKQGFDFTALTELLSFPDSLASARSVFAGHVDTDAHKDIVLVLGPPVHALAVAFGAGNGTFADSLTWIPDVHLADADAFIMSDVNGNGYPDITYLDDRRNAIVTLYGRGQRRFEGPIPVVPAEGVRSFRIAALKKNGPQDIILTHERKGSVSIAFDPFR